MSSLIYGPQIIYNSTQRTVISHVKIICYTLTKYCRLTDDMSTQSIAQLFHCSLTVSSSGWSVADVQGEFSRSTTSEDATSSYNLEVSTHLWLSCDRLDAKVKGHTIMGVAFTLLLLKASVAKARIDCY